MLRRALLLLPLLLVPTVPVAHADEAPRGIDVARYQHPHDAVIDWDAVRGAGVSFVYVKATDGTTYVNPWHADDLPRARAHGLAAGSYHFARPALPLTTALDQADLFVRRIGNQRQSQLLPPALDLESTGGLTRGDLTAWAQLFLDEVRARTGRTPVVYSYPNYLKAAVYGPALHNALLWIATYRGPVATPIPGDWPSWTIWQSSSTGRYPGIAANVDTNVFGGTAEQLASLADGSLPSAWPDQPATRPYGVALVPRTRGTLTLRWIPDNDGGNRVTSWAVSLSDGRTLSLPATGTSTVLTGLDPAVTYRATMHAVTSAGAGADNVSNPLTPLGPTVLSFTPGAGSYGSTVTAGGRLTSAGSAVAGARVRIEQRIGAERRTLATVTTGGDGRWSWSAKATANQVLRAVFDNANGYAARASAEGLRRVSAAVSLTARREVRAGGTWPVTAVVRPGEDRVVRLLVLAGGRWAVASTVHPDARGIARLAWRGVPAGNRTARVDVGSGPTTVGLIRRIDVRALR